MEVEHKPEQQVSNVQKGNDREGQLPETDVEVLREVQPEMDFELSPDIMQGLQKMLDGLDKS